MENNKAYLQKIHWVFLIAIAYHIALYLFSPWIFDPFKSYSEPKIIVTIFLSSFFYAALGLVTSKWKEAAIAFAVAIAIQAIQYFILRSKTGPGEAIKFDLTLNLIFYFIYPLPTLVFVALITGWKKKIGLLYLACLLLTQSSSLDFYGQTGLRELGEFSFRDKESLLGFLLIFVIRISFYVFHLIVICEIINYQKGKNYTSKPTLLNLGNDYTKLTSLLTFWVLKVTLLVVLLGAVTAVDQLQIMTKGTTSWMRATEGWSTFYTIIGGPMLLSFILLAVFLAWYLRKFLLENFTTFGIHSKFLYWLCLLPGIGFIVFLIVQIDGMKQTRYSEKVTSIGLFAGSSTGVITGIFFFCLGIRLIMRMVDGDVTFIFSLIITALLFLWLMVSKTGYQVSAWITCIMLVGVIIAIFVLSSDERELYLGLAFAFGLLLLNLVYLLFIYPVYHFEEFQYIPGKDPEILPENEVQAPLFPQFPSS